MFRLYVGLVRNNVWYNHAEVEEMKGGTLAVLDTIDKSGAARLLNLVKASLKKIYTEDGKVRELTEADYQDIKVVDSWKIAYEAMKNHLGVPNPIIVEYFFCKRCSSSGNERYTKVEESWQELIDKGFIDEHYFDSGNCSVWVTLPVGINIPQSSAQLMGGAFNRIRIEPLTLGELVKITNTPTLSDTEAGLIYAQWDLQIKEIEGLSERELNIYVKRDLRDSFSRKYISHVDDIEVVERAFNLGIDASMRSVSCQFCHAEVGGYLDYTNFFAFLFPKRSTPRGGREKM